MTGFGSASRELEGGTVAVELKSVNHRHLNVSLRLPAGADRWESGLRARLGKRVRRGHVSFLVVAEPVPGRGASWEMDHSRVDATLQALRTLRERYDVPGEVDLSVVVSAVRELLLDERQDDLDWIEDDQLGDVVDEAVDELIRMREVEGAVLEEDLRSRLAEFEEAVSTIESLTPQRLVKERDRLRAAVAELAEGLTVDEGRLEQEIALLADKWDIGEEVVRARAHLQSFGDLLGSDAAEPVGKRLSFLLQELNREVNTIGSKANDVVISRCVVEAKNVLEKLREQVENVE